MPTVDTRPDAAQQPGPTSRSGSRLAGAGLVLGALGVVFGDIGTSPLYALQTVFTADHHRVAATRGYVYGVISMVFLALVLVVTIKYVVLVMRADNDGEGGIMALIGSLKRLQNNGPTAVVALIILGVFGASLFFGDAMITPAISVLSAVEGLDVVSSSLTSFVMPISLAVLVGLFLIQRFGTNLVGKLFGPVIAVWFVVIAAGGVAQIVHHPGILAALSPTYGISFVAGHPAAFLIALTGIVLCITGVEALYADMGHFGRPAITRAWLLVVFPAVLLNYMGQGALVLAHPKTVSNPFFLMFPGWAQVPLVLLATAATVIASQAVISGAFSLARQAAQLGYLPRLTVRHTSAHHEGQIYVPAVNWTVLVCVVLLVLAFRSAENLADAYGIAVTGTITITTLLFLVIARYRWDVPKFALIIGGLAFGTIDLAFFGANLPKIFDGGWFPLAIGAGAFVLFTTWAKGSKIVTMAREREEGQLQAYIEEIHALDPPVHRVPGTAVFLNADRTSAPLALRANVAHNHALHESVVIVSVQVEHVPTIPLQERVTVDPLGSVADGIQHLTFRYGFQDQPDVPEALRYATGRGLECPVDVENASYFLSRVTLRRSRPARRMAEWRKRVFLEMARHAANPVEYFNLPIDRTVVMGGHITV